MWTMSLDRTHGTGLTTFEGRTMNANQPIPQYEIADAHCPQGRCSAHSWGKASLEPSTPDSRTLIPRPQDTEAPELTPWLTYHEHLIADIKATVFEYINIPPQHGDATHELTLERRESNTWEHHKILSKPSYEGGVTHTQEYFNRRFISGFHRLILLITRETEQAQTR
jgi:hypothetical protein